MKFISISMYLNTHSILKLFFSQFKISYFLAHLSPKRILLAPFKVTALLMSLFINSFLSAQITDGVYTNQHGSKLTISGCTNERLNYKLEGSGFGYCDFDGEGKALIKMGNAFDVNDYDQPDFNDYTYAIIYKQVGISLQINVSNTAQSCLNQLGSDVHNGIFTIDGLYKKAETNLPIVKAGVRGNSNKYVEWGAKPVEEGDGPAPPWSWYHNMCDGPSIESITASSSLTSQGKNNYSIQNICDDNPTTAWVEGNPDYGIGEYFELNWMPMGDGTISILNGYQSSKAAWENNSRVKKFKVSVAGKDLCIVELSDMMGIQDFKLPGFLSNSPDGGETSLRFTIMEVYLGLKWKDTAISGIFSCGG